MYNLCVLSQFRDNPKLPGGDGVVGGSVPAVKSSLYLTEKN